MAGGVEGLLRGYSGEGVWETCGEGTGFRSLASMLVVFRSFCIHSGGVVALWLQAHRGLFLCSWSWVTWGESKGLLDAFVFMEPSSIRTHALLVLCVPCNTGGLLSVRG